MYVPSTQIKSLSEKWIAQINLSEKNCIFRVEIQRIWYGMYAHNLSKITNKTNSLLLLVGE